MVGLWEEEEEQAKAWQARTVSAMSVLQRDGLGWGGKGPDKELKDPSCVFA